MEWRVVLLKTVLCDIRECCCFNSSGNVVDEGSAVYVYYHQSPQQNIMVGYILLPNLKGVIT